VLKIIWYSTGIESTLNTFDFRRLDQLCISTVVFGAPQPPQLGGGAQSLQGAQRSENKILKTFNDNCCAIPLLKMILSNPLVRAKSCLSIIA